MKRLRQIFRVPPRWRWVVWPILTISSGGTATALWLEESAALSEFAPLAALPGLASLLYWLNQCLFEATMPRRENPPNHNKPRGKN